MARADPGVAQTQDFQVMGYTHSHQAMQVRF